MEVFTFSEDSGNRITIGGKRKSSSRRSSILKAAKSPLKSGALEDLDLNSLDDNGRSRSKKCRRSSGRRVSFAKKDDVKEFFVEDWKSAWSKDGVQNSLQMSSNASHGDSEYRPPADSIKGLESLLKGNIQADDNDMGRVEVQELPEVQFNHLSAGDEESAVCYDRGILLQTITQAQVQHTVPVDVTICHGPGIISAPNNDPDASGANPSEEIDYTKCRSSVLSSDLDQTRLFSGDTGIDLDITCSQQEVFFPDHPAQLSSPENLEQSGKMDSKSFLLSLGSKPSSTQTHEAIQPTKDYMTPTSNSNAYCKRQPLGEITDMQSSMKTRQEVGDQKSNVDENVELTACHSYKGLENIVPKTKRRSIYEPVDIDVTSCYGPGLLNSLEKQEFHSLDEVRSRVSGFPLTLSVKRNSVETDLQSRAASEQTAPLDVTKCHGIGILPGKRMSVPGTDQTEVYNTDNSESLDLTVCQAQGEHDSDENLELTACHSYEVLDNSIPKTHQKNICEPADLDVTSCYGPGLIKGSSLSQNHQNDQSLSRNGSSKMDSSAFLKSLLGSKQRSSATDSEEYDDEMDLTISGNTGTVIEDKREQKKPEQPKLSMESTFSRAKSNKVVTDLSNPISLRNAYLIKNPFTKTSEEQEQTSKFHENLELTACHSQLVLDSDTQRTKRRTLYEAADLEVTSCYGPGLIQSPEKEETCDDVFTSALNLSRSLRAASTANKLNGNAVFSKAQDLPGWNKTQQQESDFNDNLDLTTCHGQSFVGSNSLKTDRRSLFGPADIDVTSCHGVGLVETSGDKLELTVLGQPGSDKSLQQANRRSFYEPADIDVTSCHGEGLVETSGDNLELTVLGQSGLDKSLRQANRRSFYEPADIDVTSCHGEGLVETSGVNLELTVLGQPGIDKSLQQANRRSFYGPADIDVTSCHGVGLVETSGDNLELTVCGQSGVDKSLQQANRRSLYKPADTDVTSCHGEGLVETSGVNLELTVRSQPAIDKSLRQANRRSFYEPADIDATSCNGVGLVETSGVNFELTVGSQPGIDKSLRQANRRSFYEPADIDVTSCHGVGLFETSGDNLELTVRGQPGIDKSLQQENQRSFYRPADLDVTSCDGPGLVKSFVETSESTVSLSQHAVDTNEQKTNRRGVYGPTDVNVASRQDAGLVKSSPEDLELTSCHIAQVLDNRTHKINRRSLYEPADLDVTSCHGPGLVKANRESLPLTTCTSELIPDNNTGNGTRRSFYEHTDLDVTSCHGQGLVKSNLESLQLTTRACDCVLDINTENATRQSFYEHVDLAIKSCSETGPVKTPDETVINDDVGKTRLNLTERTEASFHIVNANSSSDKVEDFHYSEEVLQTTRAPTNSNKGFECTDYNADKNERSASPAVGLLNQSIGDQITRNVDRQLSIICEESVSEWSKKELREDGNITQLEEEMQNTTLSPITLKKFLDITELAFITEVNMRRSIAPSNVVEAPQTPKDMIISTLVSKPKATCYEEAIPALESEITVMKEKVEQQEMELNASNPRVFMEAQSASKEELLAMQGKVRRLRSVCEKTSKREWKKEKGQLNKRILLKTTENHQALASDVHVVEESLVMVDDCLNLLDKMDNDLDEGIKNFQMSLEENEKKLQEQANLSAKLESITEALRKSEQELADLECTRSTVQSEKQVLANKKEQLNEALLQNEEAIRLLKKKDPRSGKTATKQMSQKLDILESLQEWSLEEWNDECARFTFLKSSLEMVVSFGLDIADSKDSFPNQEVKSIQLNFTPTEQFRGKMGKVHTLVKQAVNQDLLSQMCSSKKDLTKVLEHMSGTIFKSNEIGEELFRIGLTHLMSFKENRFVVEFSSLQAFVKFVLHIQLELQSYPDSLTFTVSPKIGRLSQTEIEEALNAVDAGPRYLSRLVEAADQLLSKTRPILNMPS